MTAKLLDIPPSEYHARPGLSASIATTLIQRSPAHARAEHPFYGGKGMDPTPATDRGSVGHRLLLGAGKEYEPIDVDDWRTKRARELRDEARAAGKIPVKSGDLEAWLVAANEVAKQFASRGIALDGRSELAVEWTEASPSGDVLCRGMFDHAWLDRGAILELKVVENAAPDAIERSAENLGMAIQAHAYRRAMELLRPELAGRVDFLFAFVEFDPPYAVNVVRPDGLFRELGERRWWRAVEAWGACLQSDTWPSYGSGINTLSVPAWALSREGFAP